MTTDMVRLIEPLIPPLRRYARALLRDRTAADDLVQDCLERAIGRWHQRRSDGDPRTWMFTILHNLAMTQLSRATNRYFVAFEETDESALAHPPAQEDGLRYRELLAALARLPEEQRSVLLLVTVEDISYAETAKVLDIPVGTVMSRLSRAREKLLKMMSEEKPASVGVAPARLRRVK
jgi:RNA polymerase sigma-70 factor (ECF subfamily)